MRHISDQLYSWLKRQYGDVEGALFKNQTQFSEAADDNDPNLISRLENGKRKATFDTCRGLSEATGYPVIKLLIMEGLMSVKDVGLAEISFGLHPDEERWLRLFRSYSEHERPKLYVALEAMRPLIEEPALKRATKEDLPFDEEAAVAEENETIHAENMRDLARTKAESERNN